MVENAQGANMGEVVLGLLGAQQKEIAAQLHLGVHFIIIEVLINMILIQITIWIKTSSHLPGTDEEEVIIELLVVKEVFAE